jgi:thioesterase domain-containing protein
VSYQPGKYAGRVTLLLAQNRSAQPGNTEAIWQSLALGGVDTYRVPGNHYSMFRAPRLQMLAAKVRACLPPTGATLMKRSA